MPQFPKRKTDREIIPHEKMKETVEKVISGNSLRIVAKELCVSKSTLHRYVEKVKSAPSEATPFGIMGRLAGAYASRHPEILVSISVGLWLNANLF